jgi:Dolichyl-phosphate-mannose-protein mannosyltransferase
LQALSVNARPEETSRHSKLLLLAIFVLGLVLRVAYAYATFLNPDEALHYLLALPPTIALTYKASLTTAHPPLLILLLHYWEKLGRSELFLRLPSVLAGSGLCWLSYCWMKMVADRTTALITFALLSFLPPVVSLSAEVRQYALLLFFCSAALYFFERGWRRNSIRLIVFAALMLYLALLTHYSALIFALAHGIYGLARFVRKRRPGHLVFPWVLGQVGALGLIAFLWVTQVTALEARGVPRTLADPMISGSLYQAGTDNPLEFAIKTSLRFFHYLSWNGAIGVMALLLFIGGIVLLFGRGEPAGPGTPSSRQLALLLALPFAITLAAAFLRKYPYGGTRHDVLLALFAAPGIAVALSRLQAQRKWPVTIGLVTALVIGNFFPAPRGAYIKPRFQTRNLMREAIYFLSNAPPKGATILADEESGAVLSYYLCHGEVVQFGERRILRRFSCGDDSVLTSDRFIYTGATLADGVRQLDRTTGNGANVWFFQAGWDVGLPDLRRRLSDYGCPKPTTFGQNILVCKLTIPDPPHTFQPRANDQRLTGGPPRSSKLL